MLYSHIALFLSLPHPPPKTVACWEACALLHFYSQGFGLLQGLLGMKHPHIRPPSAVQLGAFVFSHSFCQNTEGSRIPKRHLRLRGDAAVHSGRRSGPHHHLAGKRESCKSSFFLALVSAPAFLNTCCVIMPRLPCLLSAVFSPEKCSPSYPNVAQVDLLGSGKPEMKDA